MCLQQILKYHDFDVLSRNSIFVETFFNCSLRRWFSFNFSTRLVFFIFLPFKWVSRQKWACLEILMRKIVAIATDLSFSGRQVCSYQCPSISSLCAPDTIGNRYKTLYFPPNVPGKCSILWSIPKLISLLRVSKFFAIFQIVTLNSLDAKMGWCYLLPHELQGFIGSESDKRPPTEIQFK